MQKSRGERCITILGELELLNALGLRVFRKELCAQQVRSSLRDFEKDVASSYALFSSKCLSSRLARLIASNHRTRTADLLHVAAALELNADYIYSFDRSEESLLICWTKDQLGSRCFYRLF